MKLKTNIVMLTGTFLLQAAWLFFLLSIFKIIPDQYFFGSMKKLQENRDSLNTGHNSAILIVCVIVLICIDINILFIKRIKPIFSNNMLLLCRSMPLPLYIGYIFSGSEHVWLELTGIFVVLAISSNNLRTDMTQKP